MKITEDTINHNAVRIINNISENSYDFCSAKNAEAERENAMYMAMTLGNIVGVLEMARAMKAVLKS